MVHREVQAPYGEVSSSRYLSGAVAVLVGTSSLCRSRQTGGLPGYGPLVDKRRVQEEARGRKAKESQNGRWITHARQCTHDRLQGEQGEEPSMFVIWTQFYKKKDKVDGTLSWVSENAALKDKEYREFSAKAHASANPETKPFDPEVAMCAGGGRKNDRLWMCDNAVDPRTVRSMREIRRDNSSSSSSIQSRPTTSSRTIDRIRLDLENERRQREQAEALIAQQQQQMMQQNQMMVWFT